MKCFLFFWKIMCLNLSLPSTFSHCARACQAQVELIGFCPAAKVGARWPSNAAAKLVEFAFNAALKPKPNKFRNKLFASFCQKRELWMAKNVAAYIQLSARD